MKPQKLLAFAVAVLLSLTGSALAQLGAAGDTQAADQALTDHLVAAPKKSFLTGDLIVTTLSEYNPRGLIAENQGVIGQAFLDLYFKFYEGKGFIQSITGQLGFLWVVTSHVQNSVKPTDSTRNWFEFDGKPAIAVGFADRFVLTISYIDAYSPSGAFHTARSLNTTLDFNDTDLLGAYALHPHLTVLRELPAPGTVGLRPNGWYYEPGIAPNYVFGKGNRYPVTCILPVTFGLGSNHFYAGNTFGYASTGLSASVPLAFIPAGYGTWTATAGYNYYYIGNALAREMNTGHHDEHVFYGTISMTF